MESNRPWSRNASVNYGNGFGCQTASVLVKYANSNESKYTGSVLFKHHPKRHFIYQSKERDVSSDSSSLTVVRSVSGDCGTMPLKHGYGQCLFSNGDLYDGDYHMNVIHGHGTYTYRDGSTYSGEYRNGKYNGKGVLSLWTKESYSGKFKANQRSGYGLCTFPNKDVYSGYWRCDKPHGYGTLTSKNKDIPTQFFGQWVDGVEDGEGLLLEGVVSEDVLEREVFYVKYERGECVRSSLIQDVKEIENEMMRWNKLCTLESAIEGKEMESPRRPDYLGRFYRRK